MRRAIYRTAIVALAAGVPAYVEPAVAEAFKAVPEAKAAAAKKILGGWTVIGMADQRGHFFIAAEGGARCPNGYVCLYQNRDHQGFGLGIPRGYGLANLKAVPCTSCENGTHGNDGTFNDQMSSWVNHSGQRYCWYVNRSEKKGKHTMPNGQFINVLPGENDLATTVEPC